MRSYHNCSLCHLIFVPAEYHVTDDAEKAIYDLHQNSPEDEGYRKFLNRLLIPLCNKLAPNAQGLDFGCGPGPAIKPMLEAQGFTVNNYDIYYYKQENVLQKKYDFITTTEAIEHFNQPRKELELLDSLLRSGGYLGIMTKRPTSLEAFSRWHYKNDQTHICFFSEKTFQWIASAFNYQIEFPGPDTVIMKKM
ncbi:class I SAM-dependent methyltransferase [Kangiella japonica]|uniref:Class I SAM-dependent methyltransferase n=1 Tax=Kangiella japonica TaxID=647384 RepID=A0ABN0SVF4_9GAMM